MPLTAHEHPAQVIEPTLRDRRARIGSRLELDEGSVFARRYRVVGCIAMGGMGAVY